MELSMMKLRILKAMTRINKLANTSFKSSNRELISLRLRSQAFHWEAFKVPAMELRRQEKISEHQLQTNQRLEGLTLAQ
jgi:hypothetical protein